MNSRNCVSWGWYKVVEASEPVHSVFKVLIVFNDFSLATVITGNLPSSGQTADLAVYGSYTTLRGLLPEVSVFGTNLQHFFFFFIVAEAAVL